MHTPDMSDAQLWQNIQANDRRSFDALFARHWVRLFNTAQKYLNDASASEEVVHDVFLSIWTRREVLQIQKFESFLLSAVRYQIYGRIRSSKLSVVFVSDEAAWNLTSTSSESDFHLKENELHDELVQQLALLPKRCREIFRMSRMDDISNDEIAQRLQISKRSVENQLTAALKHLRGVFRHLASVFL